MKRSVVSAFKSVRRFSKHKWNQRQLALERARRKTNRRRLRNRIASKSLYRKRDRRIWVNGRRCAAKTCVNSVPEFVSRSPSLCCECARFRPSPSSLSSSSSSSFIIIIIIVVVVFVVIINRNNTNNHNHTINHQYNRNSHATANIYI